jgi:hypothetical protein
MILTCAYDIEISMLSISLKIFQSWHFINKLKLNALM